MSYRVAVAWRRHSGLCVSRGIVFCRKECRTVRRNPLYGNKNAEFDENIENADTILKEIKNKTFQEVDSTATRICPACNTPMVKMGAGIAGVEIDYCNVCGAKFLDNGELENIRNGIKADISNIDNIINNLYQDNLKDIIGDKNYNSVIKNSPRRQFFENLVNSYLKK